MLFWSGYGRTRDLRVNISSSIDIASVDRNDLSANVRDLDVSAAFEWTHTLVGTSERAAEEAMSESSTLVFFVNGKLQTWNAYWASYEIPRLPLCNNAYYIRTSRIRTWSFNTANIFYACVVWAIQYADVRTQKVCSDMPSYPCRLLYYFVYL